MTSVSIAGRYSAPSGFGPLPQRRGTPAGPRGLSLAAFGVSFAAHVLLLLGMMAMIVWNDWHSSRVYVVNLVPMVAAVGNPTAPTHKASLPAPPAPVLPSRAPSATPTPDPRERPMRETPRLPEPAQLKPSLPPRTAAPLRAGEKELPSLAHSTSASHVEKPQRTERPVESRPGDRGSSRPPDRIAGRRGRAIARRVGLPVRVVPETGAPESGRRMAASEPAGRSDPEAADSRRDSA